MLINPFWPKTARAGIYSVFDVGDYAKNYIIKNNKAPYYIGGKNRCF